MRFLVDAQLTHLLCKVLHQRNHNAIHVKQLPEGDDTSDNTIIKIADIENQVVVTKDSDFYYSHITTGKPSKLLLIKTGNVKNNQLLTLIRINISLIESLFENCDFLELNSNGVVIRES